jgi:hypothetical protein
MEYSNLGKTVNEKVIPFINKSSLQIIIETLPKKDAAICNTVLMMVQKFGFNPDIFLNSLTTKLSALTNDQLLKIEDYLLDIIDGKEVTMQEIITIFKGE